MKTKTMFPGIKNSQKIRVILNGVGFYTVVKDIDKICTTKHRTVVSTALSEIANSNGKSTGYASRIDDVDFQVDIV